MDHWNQLTVKVTAINISAAWESEISDWLAKYENIPPGGESWRIRTRSQLGRGNLRLVKERRQRERERFCNVGQSSDPRSRPGITERKGTTSGAALKPKSQQLRWSVWVKISRSKVLQKKKPCHSDYFAHWLSTHTVLLVAAGASAESACIDQPDS